MTVLSPEKKTKERKKAVSIVLGDFLFTLLEHGRTGSHGSLNHVVTKQVVFEKFKTPTGRKKSTKNNESLKTTFNLHYFHLEESVR